MKVVNSSYSLDLSLRALVQESCPNKGPVEGTSEEVVLREESGFHSLKPILVFGGGIFQESAIDPIKAIEHWKVDFADVFTVCQH